MTTPVALFTAALCCATPLLASAAERATDEFREGQLSVLLMLDERFDSDRIEADVRGDRVQLAGTVDDSRDRAHAARLARSLTGIREVSNRLEIGEARPTPATRPVPAVTFRRHVMDAGIESQVAQRLERDPYTADAAIDVIASGGIVTLTGTVDTRHARTLAQQLADAIAGVDRVENRIEIAPKAAGQVPLASDGDRQLADSWIARRIWSALDATRGIAAERIDVRSNAGRVTLSGVVDSPRDRRRAIDIAQGIRGVHEVDARGLAVDPSLVAQFGRVDEDG